MTPTLPDWQREKYLQWPPSHHKPSVRVPLPTGSYHSVTVTPGDTETDTLQAAILLRDTLGEKLWGAHRWKEIVTVRTRSVAKHRQRRVGPITGVHHEPPKAPGQAAKWIATWYERTPSHGTRKRSRQHSYGTPHAAYPTSEAAQEAAIRCRQENESRWYSVLGDPGQRQANRR